jgi:hypothetical protein
MSGKGEREREREREGRRILAVDSIVVTLLDLSGRPVCFLSRLARVARRRRN